MAQFNTGYYPHRYSTYPSPYGPPYAAYSYTTPWPAPTPASYPVQPQPTFAQSLVTPQPQPNVPLNRPSSQAIAGYGSDRSHNQGLSQVTVLNPTTISTTKPLTARPKNPATIKTPDGKVINLDKDSSTSKNPSTTTTPSTKTTPTPTTTKTATTTTEHVHTLLQAVSEDIGDSKKGGSAEKKANEGKSADKVAAIDKKADDKAVTAKKSEVVEKDKKRVVADNGVTDKKVDFVKEDKVIVVKESEEINDKENEPIKTETKIDKEVVGTKEAEIKKVVDVQEDEGEPKEAENDEKDDATSKSEDKDESSNSGVSLKYEPGQYHPITNTSGKKKYSRQFLMDVRNNMEKAENIEFPPSIRTDPFDLSERFGYSRQIASRQLDLSRRQGQVNYSGRSSAGQEKQRKVITSVSLTQEVELKTSSNPWRPAKDAKEEAPQDIVETESLKKKFRSILNKLTPNNFDSLAQSVTALNIDTESRLGDVIDIVFAKALAEPGYCVLYGQMCSHLKKTTADGTNFGNTLLKRCQNQFQSDTYSGLSLDERKEKIEKEENPELKKQLEEELYEEMYRCRMRSLGLIKFIGELYKIEMLNDAIMFDCVLRLLSDQSEEALECLCDLLVTIGEKLDKRTSEKLANAEKEKKATKGASKNNAYQGGSKSVAAVVAAGPAQQRVEAQISSLDHVFEQLRKMIKNDDLPLSKRIRFKLLDTCELREKDRWQSKKTRDNNPKKIEEIRKAHEEKLEQEKRQVNAMGPRRSQEHRRLGHSSGSSNQISSLANESGGHRGGLHQSASSHLIRDHHVQDNMRSNQNEAERKDFQRSLQGGVSFLKNLTAKNTISSPSDTALRPVSMTKRTD